MARAGPADGGLPMLADRIEGLISQEHARWVSVRVEGAAQGRQPTPALLARAIPPHPATFVKQDTATKPGQIDSCSAHRPDPRSTDVSGTHLGKSLQVCGGAPWSGDHPLA
jgi:hypothetical protein